jgi:thiamine-phosphate diphosphorylase
MLCLVTDRRRLLRATGQAEREWPSLIEQQVEGAVRAGIDFVQIRERDLDARTLLTLTRSLMALAAGSTTKILVNDRADVALAARASGVHLRADSPAVAQILSVLGQGFIVSRAVHDGADVDASRAAHIFVAGTMFPTRSKADKHRWLGVSGMAAIVQAAGTTPVLAIGGVTERNAHEVARSGACGLASIGGFIPEERGADIGRHVVRQVERFRAAFLQGLR